jgi:hypothetical protein
LGVVFAWSPSAAPLDPIVRIQAVSAAMPAGAALGGWAALRWLGVARLDGRTGPGADLELPVQVCLGPVGRMRRQRGIVLDRSTILDADLAERDGVLVTSAARSCLDVARRLGVEEGLVATDAALQAGATTSTELSESVARLAGIRGVPQARLVVTLADGGAESAPESRLRYVWIVEAGLPSPLVNPDVLTLSGFFVARTDLLDPDAGMVGEYDGAAHRELDRHTADNVREEDIEDLGLQVVRATSIDLWPERRRLVRRLQTTHARVLTRDRSRDHWLVRPREQ